MNIVMSALVVLLIIMVAFLLYVVKEQHGLIIAQKKYIYTIEKQNDLLKADIELYRMQNKIRGQ